MRKPASAPSAAPSQDELSRQTPVQHTLEIDVISDVVCPWCYIGKRQLEQALAMRSQRSGHAPVQVRWHPFQLNPELPADGMTRAVYLQDKFGSSDGGDVYAKVSQAAAAVGLNIDFKQILRQPNTTRAHALLSMTQDTTQDRLAEGLFDAYFLRALDLTEDYVLIEVARACGLAEPMIEAALNDESVHEAIRSADNQARHLGVSSVPYFIFNQRLAVSGAAGAETLLAAADKATALDDEVLDEPEGNPPSTQD